MFSSCFICLNLSIGVNAHSFQNVLYGDYFCWWIRCVVFSVGVCGFVRFAVVLLWGVLVVLVIVLLRVWSNGRWAIPFVIVFELFVWSV